ncbi:MAG: hypothetical protein ACRDUT_13550 [Mycobacterium sp.]
MNNARGAGAPTPVSGYPGGGHLRLPGLRGGRGAARIVTEPTTHSCGFIHSRAVPWPRLRAGGRRGLRAFGS